ncbi:sulfotransferase family protein [Vibrio sp. 2-Bac 85]
MPIFYKDNKRILFIHIPKCGGSYIEHLFLKNGFKVEYLDGGKEGNLNFVRKCSPQHMHFQMLDMNFNLDRFDYVFTVVRKPLERIISEAHMRIGGQNLNISLDEWILKALENYSNNNYIYDNHLRPQIEFVYKGVDVFKQEDGLDDNFILKIEKKIGLHFEFKNIGRKMTRNQFTNGKELLINEKTQKCIKKFYSKDYKEFGYDL